MTKSNLFRSPFLTLHSKLGSKSNSKLEKSDSEQNVPNSNSNEENVLPETSEETSNPKSDTLPEYVIHNVDHFRQEHYWDCGVACVMMVLPPEKRQHFLENFNSVCYEEDFGHSTWTIDLCYLLKRYGIEHRMYTTQLGVNENLKKFKYYENLEMDRNRVQQRFEDASACGLRVHKGELSEHALRKHLAEHGPAILLVDYSLLACDLCKHNKLKYEFRRMFGGSYCGHYVVVSGYAGGRFLYRDPARRARVCAARPARLLAAHRAPGTDSDLLLLYTAPPAPSAPCTTDLVSTQKVSVLT